MLKHTAVALALSLLACPVLAQDADPPADTPAPDTTAPDTEATPGEQDAKDLLGDRAKPPSDDSDGPVLQESGNAGRMQGTITTGGTTTTETVSETTETSVRIGVDPDESAAPSGGWGSQRGPGWGRPDRADNRGGSGSARDLAGEWTLMIDGGGTCRITLTDQASFGGYDARTSGCTNDFFMVNRWFGGSGEIRFTVPGDKSVGQLTRTGRNRFEGRLESNGARIVLTR